MHCSRCTTGLLYETVCWDEISAPQGFFTFVCINCGNVVDDIIMKNREFPMPDKRLTEHGTKKYVRNGSNQSSPPLRMRPIKI